MVIQRFLVCFTIACCLCHRHEGSETINQVTPNDTTDDISQVTPNGTTDDISQVMPNDVSDDIGQVKPNDVSDDISQVTPNDVSDDISQVTPNDVSDDIGQVTPNDVSDDISQVTANDVSDDISQVTPNDTTDDIGQVTSNVSDMTFNDTAAYINLVRLQAEHCRPKHLCSLSPRASLLKRYECCTECSCDDDCVENRNCCADFFVSDLLNNTLFDDVTKFISVLDNITDNDGLIIAKALSGSPFQGKYRIMETEIDGYTCSPTSVYSTQETSTILMKASCPVDYQNDTLIKLCEEVHNTIIVINRELIKRIQPVTSAESGVIYRNKFCFMCNSFGNESGIPWEMLYELDTVISNVGVFFTGFDDVLQAVSEENGQNIRFRSPASQNSHSNIDYCVSPSQTDYDTSFDPLRYRTCRLFNGPFVTGLRLNQNTNNRGVQYDTIKNIACLPRIRSSRQMSNCLTQDRALFLINHDPNTGEYLNRTSVFLLNVQTSARCSKGYVFDVKENHCRQILCPMHWYNQHGGCRLMFTQFVNGIYSIGIAVSAPWIPKSDEVNNLVNIISVAFKTVLYIHFGNSVPEYEHSIWEYPDTDDDSPAKYFVNIRIRSVDVTYITILRLLSNILKVVESYMNIHGIKASVEIADEILPNAWVGSSREFNLVTSNVPLMVRWSNNITLSTNFTVPIRKANLCYRIMVLDKEMARVGRRYFISKRTRRLFTSLDIQYSLNKQMNVVCLNAVDDVPDDIMLINLQGSEVSGSDVQPTARLPEDVYLKENDYLRGLWTLVAITCLVILLMAVYRLRNRMRHRRAVVV